MKTNHSQYLEIIETRNLFLIEGQKSESVVLTDSTGNMYFTFYLKNVKGNGTTTISIEDKYHASIIIETNTHAIVTLPEPYLIGNYEGQKDLLFNFVIQPCNADNTHNVTITFYTSKNRDSVETIIKEIKNQK